MRRVLSQYKFDAVCQAIKGHGRYSSVYGIERVDVHSDIVYIEKLLFMVYEKKTHNVCVFNIGKESPDNIRAIFRFAVLLHDRYKVESVEVSSMTDKWAILRQILSGCETKQLNGCIFTTINLCSNIQKLKELSR